MSNISVIILTKNEEKNIAAAIESAKLIANRILVIDSGSEDNTVKISESSGAEVYFHEWPGHAAQFNWAIDNCNISSEWIFRLDADERISEELADEINNILPSTNADGYEMRRRIVFMGKWIKHGGMYKRYTVRLFRYGSGRVEELLMDEHIIVNGIVEKLNGDIIHFDYKDFNAWLHKHIWYSNLEYQLYNEQIINSELNSTQKKKRNFYYRMPLFLRARLYYWFRYYIQLGFLDGKEGKIFCFLQAYWYRFIVDSKIYEESKMKDI